MTLKEKAPINRGFLITGGVGGNRTPDTRIFSPLLYQLSYRTVVRDAKVSNWNKLHQIFSSFFLITL